MAGKLKKSTLFFSWNCFWNPVLAQGMKEPWNDLCWGNRNGLMITTLDTVPVLGSSSHDQRYHCCTLFPPVEPPECISIWSDIHPRALQSIFRFRGHGPLCHIGSQLNQSGLPNRPEENMRPTRGGKDDSSRLHLQRAHGAMLSAEVCRLWICTKCAVLISLERDLSYGQLLIKGHSCSPACSASIMSRPAFWLDCFCLKAKNMVAAECSISMSQNVFPCLFPAIFPLPLFFFFWQLINTCSPAHWVSRRAAGHHPRRLIPNIWYKPVLSVAIAVIVVSLRPTPLGSLCHQTAEESPPSCSKAERAGSKLFHFSMVDHWSLQ